MTPAPVKPGEAHFVSRQEFHVEHIIARFHGGTDEPENLALACPRCNHRKGTNLSGIDPDTGTSVPLFHPRRDAGSDHFVAVGPRLIGKTPVGQTAIWVLDLNAEDRLKVREILAREGVWPEPLPTS